MPLLGGHNYFVYIPMALTTISSSSRTVVAVLPSEHQDHLDYFLKAMCTASMTVRLHQTVQTDTIFSPGNDATGISTLGYIINIDGQKAQGLTAWHESRVFGTT